MKIKKGAHTFDVSSLMLKKESSKIEIQPRRLTSYYQFCVLNNTKRNDLFIFLFCSMRMYHNLYPNNFEKKFLLYSVVIKILQNIFS